MPIFSHQGQPYDTLEIDHERWPAGHYRGRGNDQSHTGPHGEWLGLTPRWVVPPERRQEARGPKSYRRCDERLAEEVNDRIASLGQVEDMHGVSFDVRDAIVVLSGYVRSRRAKRLAEDEVADVWGIDDVINELRIDPDRTP